MKIKFKFLLLLAFVATVFVSCNNDDDIPEPAKPAVSYIINYGDYSGAKSTVTSFSKETGEFFTDYYKSINGVSMVSNVQHAFSFNNKIYFLGNSSDQLFWVDGETFEQTENAITTDIVKPRFGVDNGNYLYVSCWGGDIWADENTSYIAKINLTTKTVEKKIALPGGPEGLAVAHNKLFAALNYKDSVAVVDLSNDAISYIQTPAVTSYFVKDKNENLYVSLVSTFSDFSDKAGIGYINTSSNKLETTYDLPGVSTSYVNILSANNDLTKLYVMTSEYDADWNLSGAVKTFNMNSKNFETNNLVEGIAGLNGIAFYNDNIFCFVAESVTGNGSAKIYDDNGTLVSEFETGIAPYMLLTVEK
jgi:hypothetical protein